MINYLKGNILDIQSEKEKPKIIVHVCNNCGGWGKGFVLEISKKWKEPENRYRELYREGLIQLGRIDFIKVEDYVWICNMVAQNGYKNYNNPTPCDLGALDECLWKLNAHCQRKETEIRSVRLGCNNGGRTWSEIEPLIEKNIKRDIFVYDFEKDLK